MMAENPWAFPVSTIDGFTQQGMTLRDWFAGQAIAGVMGTARNLGEVNLEERTAVFLQIAAWMYEIADAMLAARSAGVE